MEDCENNAAVANTQPVQPGNAKAKRKRRQVKVVSSRTDTGLNTHKKVTHAGNPPRKATKKKGWDLKSRLSQMESLVKQLKVC